MGLRIYLSGPVTGLEPQVARARFLDAAESVKEHGHIPFNPLEVKPDLCTR